MPLGWSVSTLLSQEAGGWGTSFTWRSTPQHGSPGGTHARETCVEPAQSQDLLETSS